MILDPPFTVAKFFAVFDDCNAAIWPLQIVTCGLGGLVVIALRLRRPLAHQIILSVLAILWALNTMGYHFLFSAEINPIALGNNARRGDKDKEHASPDANQHDTERMRHV